MILNKEALRKLVCKKIYKSNYNPNNVMKIDWNKMQHDFEHEPENKLQYLKNESRATFYKQELILIDNKIQFLLQTLELLQSKHEKWYFENNILYRYRDSISIEGKNILEGPDNVSIEDWGAYIYNILVEYKEKIESQIGITIKGDVGEQNIANALEKSKYASYVVHNVVLDVSDSEGKTNEIDTYVITPKGIFILEVKNYGKKGTTLKITDTDKWKLIDNKTGRVIKYEKNPEGQNKRHTRATHIKVQELFGKEVPLFPLIVIGNNKVKLDNRSNIVVKNVDDFISYIENMEGKNILSSDEMFELKRIFEKADIGSNAFSVISYREWVYHMMGIFEKIYPFLCYNQEAKNVYYARHKKQQYSIVVITVLILLCMFIFTKNMDAFLLKFFYVCLVVTIGFGIYAAIQKVKDFIKVHRR